MLRNLILQNRSYRRFYEDDPVEMSLLEELIDLARNSASAGNKQSLKYILSTSREMNAMIFPTLAWAGYLKNWNGPEPGERPGAYIVILGDREISEKFYCDHGIAAQSILLGATEKGLGGCIIGSINRKSLEKILGLSRQYEILLVLALGKPREKVVLEEARDNDIRYWRDDQQVHHVPKRPLQEFILNRFSG
jgi:nitroreductase